MNNIYVKHTNQNLKSVEDALDRDKFLSAEEAKEFGLIDLVVEKNILNK